MINRSSERSVRWGLLSTANINRRLIPAIRASRRGQLVAVASRDIEKARAYAAEWNIPRVFASYEEMLSSSEIDAVYIGLPNLLHSEWAVRALKAGKHVLCEKPFATTLEDTEAMITASRETGRVLMEAFMYRHHPATILVSDWLKTGRLGDIVTVRSAFSFYMENRAGNVRLNSKLHGGALWDIGVYPVSFSQYVFGELPESVIGQQWVGESGVDETFNGQLNYSGGRSAQISCSFRVPPFTSFELHGTLGRLTLNRPFTGINDRGREIIFTGVDGKPEKLRVKSIDPYQLEVDNMNEAILEGKPTLVTLDESHSHVITSLALYESAKSGQVVRLR